MKKVYKNEYEHVRVEMSMVSIDETLKQAGLNDNGSIQSYHTANVLRRIGRYMPYRSGSLIKLMNIQTDINKPYIRVKAPQAHYLYRGALWVSDITGSAWARKGETKRDTGIPLKYHTGRNPQAGPDWANRLVQAEGEAMAADLQQYIDRSARRGR